MRIPITLPLLRRFALIVCLLMPAACSRLAPVEGTVTLDGKPLPGASVSFAPLDRDGQPAGGGTDAEGRFRVKTRTNDGVMPASYKILLSKREYPPEAKQRWEQIAKDVGEQVKDPQVRAMTIDYRWSQESSKWIKHLVPETYRSFDKTPLRVEIRGGGNKDLRLELSSQAE